MKYELKKLIDGEWYKHGVYKDINTLCRAYGEVSKYADDIKADPIEEQTDIRHCDKCDYLQVEGAYATCPYMVGIRKPEHYCYRANEERR